MVHSSEKIKTKKGGIYGVHDLYIYIASLSEISHLAHYNLLISKHVSLVSTNSKQIMPGGYIYIN
jgi:hypothetical protein